MPMTRFGRSFLLIALAALATTAPAAPIPDGVSAPVLYFPTKVGTKWVYQQNGDNLAEVVSRAEAKRGATVLTVQVLSATGEPSYAREVSVSADGVFFLGITDADAPLTRPMCLLYPKARAGVSWHVRVDGADGTPVVLMTRTARGDDTVDVPAGRFRVVKVETAVPPPAGGVPEVTMAYYAADIGLVKEETRSDAGTWTTTRALKSFTPGKG